MDHDLGMAPGDLDGKPYAPFWNPDMGPLPSHAVEALARGMEASSLGFPLTEAHRLLEPGYLPLETGYTRLASGELFVAVLTRMPRVTGAMIDWWFGWHGGESQRYKLWHPRSHVAVRSVKNVSDDPRLSDREKYVDNPHRVVEYMGAKRLSLRIHLLGAEPYLNASRCAGAGVETVVGARVGFPGWPFDFANLIHFVRRTDDGCEMRSRFWLGRVRWHTRRARVHGESYPWNRLLGHLSVRESDARAMLVHCAMEMQHLASFLPDLFEALGRR